MTLLQASQPEEYFLACIPELIVGSHLPAYQQTNIKLAFWNAKKARRGVLGVIGRSNLGFNFLG